MDLQGCELIDDDALECLAQCASPNNPHLSNESSRTYCEDVPLACPNGYALSGSWTVNSQEPVYQYCGYCTCWRANYVNQMPRNSYYSPCQSRQYQSSYRNPASFSKSRDLRRTNVTHNSSHNRQECHRDVFSYLHGSADGGVLNAERDIEEICCRPRDLHSGEDNSWGNGSSIKLTLEEDTQYLGCERGGEFSHTEDIDNISYGKFQLSYLNLSGCWRVTDEGLLALVEAKAVDRLCHLDLSGCFQLSGEGLRMVTMDTKFIKAENLYYCDNIVDGPYPTQANGCANLCNPVRMCCRSGR